MAKPLTVKQVAERFGRSTQTVIRWIKSGQIKYMRVGNGPHMFTEAHIAAFEKRNTVEAIV